MESTVARYTTDMTLWSLLLAPVLLLMGLPLIITRSSDFTTWSRHCKSWIRTGGVILWAIVRFSWRWSVLAATTSWCVLQWFWAHLRFWCRLATRSCSSEKQLHCESNGVGYHHSNAWRSKTVTANGVAKQNGRNGHLLTGNDGHNATFPGSKTDDSKIYSEIQENLSNGNAFSATHYYPKGKDLDSVKSGSALSQDDLSKSLDTQDNASTKNGFISFTYRIQRTFNDLSKRPQANGTAGKKPASGTTTSAGGRGGSTPAATMATQKAEILRLESLCESRTKELTMARIQYRDTTKAFDAMSVLVNYCSDELEAFKKQLADCMAQIAELNQAKSSLDSSLLQATQERDEHSQRAARAEELTEQGVQEHARRTREIEETHDAALTAQRDELTRQHQEAVTALQEQHGKQIDRLKQHHERQTNDVKNELKMEMNGLRISHLEEIQELRNKHDAQMEELHKQHRNKLEDITHRFETIKLTLSDKVESLRGECEELTQRAKNSEDALQRDADVKVQMAIAPFLNLPKEVESLKTVVEMRNEEIQRLRSKNMDLEKQLEEIPIGREKIISLQQKVENLEAIINIKTDHEKQLHEKCQILMRKYDRESRANKTLSMEHEQMVWRMSQSAEFGSSDSLASLTASMTSLPGSLSGGGGGGGGGGTSSGKKHASRSGGGGDRLRHPRAGSSDATSPDTRASPMSRSFHAGEEVTMRVKSKRASSGSGHRKSTGGGGSGGGGGGVGRRGADWDSERKLRSRSATFVVERDDSIGGGDAGESSSGSGGSHSLSSSPQAKQHGHSRRGRQLSQGTQDWVMSGEFESSGDATISSNLSQSAGTVVHYELPSQASKRRGGEGDGSQAPVIVAAVCTSTPRLDETFDSTTSTTTADSTREDIIEDSNVNGVMTASMGSSCTRSISSGVSDSGVYDSMTRSELLNSSMISTDSEWGTASNNASMTLDATLDMDDIEARSGPKAGDFSSFNDVTLVPGSSVSSSRGFPSSSSSANAASAPINRSFTISLDESPSIAAPTAHSMRPHSHHPPSYNQQVSVPDDVFDEDMSMESCSFATGDAGHGEGRRQGMNSMTSSTVSIEERDEDEEEEEVEEDGGFSVTCSDTVTDLAGVCSNKSLR